MKTNVKNIVLFMAHIVSTCLLIIYGIRELGHIQREPENSWIVFLSTFAISMYIIVPYCFTLKLKLFKGFGLGIEILPKGFIMTVGFIRIYGSDMI